MPKFTPLTVAAHDALKAKNAVQKAARNVVDRREKALRELANR